MLRDGLQSRLDEIGLGAVPKPDRPAADAPVDAGPEDEDQGE